MSTDVRLDPGAAAAGRADSNARREGVCPYEAPPRASSFRRSMPHALSISQTMLAAALARARDG
jgi:hypothetical protein